jgi:hypothetical protein
MKKKLASAVAVIAPLFLFSPSVHAQQTGGLPALQSDLAALALRVATAEGQIATLQSAVSLLQQANQTGPFTLASITGTYVFELRGHGNAMIGIPGLADFSCPNGPCFTVVQQNFSILTPNAATGFIVSDGNGNIIGGTGLCFGASEQEIIQDNTTSPPTQGFPIRNESGTFTNAVGTYTVNSDGTGTMSFTTTGTAFCSGSTDLSFILAGNGKMGAFWNTFHRGQGFGDAFIGSFMKQ